MSNINFVPIITAFMALIGAIITYYIVPMLKGTISTGKLISIMNWVEIAVAAAEQMKAAGIINVPKKDFVIKFLKDKGITITDQELDALIEAAVYEINQASQLLQKDLSVQEEVVKSE